MTNTIERSITETVSISVELTTTGFQVTEFRNMSGDDYVTGELRIEDIIDAEVSNESISSHGAEPRNRVSPVIPLLAERRLKADGVESLLEYRSMLLRGVLRIDQYILECGDE